MPVRGVRGATSATENTREEILDATRELLEAIIERNDLEDFGEIISAVFTTTTDLNACFPAEAARSIGMNHVPLICASEIDVQGAMPQVIRVLLHVNTEKSQLDMTHVYLREAKALRRDLSDAQ